MRNSAKQLPEFQFPEKCVILLGAESQGMSPELQSVCDEFIYIPMVGMVTSYNVSVAAAIILYEVFRQKGQSLLLNPRRTFKTTTIANSLLFHMNQKKKMSRDYLFLKQVIHD